MFWPFVALLFLVYSATGAYTLNMICILTFCGELLELFLVYSATGACVCRHGGGTKHAAPGRVPAHPRVQPPEVRRLLPDGGHALGRHKRGAKRPHDVTVLSPGDPQLSEGLTRTQLCGKLTHIV